MRVEIEIKNVSPELALECVQQVVKMGKISHDTKGKPYYCWATTFDTNMGEVVVYTREYRKNDCFLVTKRK